MLKCLVEFKIKKLQYHFFKQIEIITKIDKSHNVYLIYKKINYMIGISDNKFLIKEKKSYNYHFWLTKELGSSL